MIKVLPQCVRELKDLDLSVDLRGELSDYLRMLEVGLRLRLPVSRPMPQIGKAVHELRMHDASGQYRVFYLLSVHGDIWVLAAFKKKTRETPWHRMELVRKRVREIK